MILIGRAISGFVVGITTLAFPLFLAEALQPHVRGMLGLLPTALGNTGNYFCSSIIKRLL